MKLPTNLRAFASPASVFRLIIAVAAILITVATQWSSVSFESAFANEWLRDHFIRLHASTEPENRVVIVDIDETSLASVGPWPWPRQRMAELVEKLLGPYAARSVALDLVLPERGDMAGDTRLQMLAQHGPVVLAQAFDYVVRAQPLRIGHVAGGLPASAGTAAPSATGHIGNHAGLADARHLGNIGFVPDADGTIRRLPMMTLFEERQYPTLSLALLACCSDTNAIPQSGDAFRRIPYSRDWSAYTVVPAASVLATSVPSETIAGRLVIIGSSSLGLTDRVATPLAPSTSGVMVHASALSTLLDEQAGQTVARWPGQVIATLFSIVVALGAARTFSRLSAASNIAMLALASVAWLLLAYWINPHDPYFSTTGPLVSNLFLLAVAVPLEWQIAQRKSRSLLGTLRQYVATAVVDELLRRNLTDPLTPRKLHVTTLIADMEGYTTYVEALPMEDAAQLTSDFLACLTRPILARHGTIDKYTGDGIVAFWGAPLPVEDHADLALDAARDVLEEVRRFSEMRQKTGLPALRVRIGIESGIAMAGDFGSASRSIYTAVGDSVNVAARLEQVARDQPHDIIIGPGTASRAKRHAFTLLGEFTLRGKGKVTTLFTLADPGSEISA